MKKIVPYKKELEFNTEVAEITSISLENTLKKASDNFVTGEFTISGEYKIVEFSMNTEKFEFKLPFDINIDSKYDTTNMVIDIDDFYYELNKNKMIVNISVSLDELEEKLLERSKDSEIKEVKVEERQVFEDINTKEAYRTYKVYIVRENDTLESIMEKFNVTKDELEDYNDLSKLNASSKLIIPTNNDEKL